MLPVISKTLCLLSAAAAAALAVWLLRLKKAAARQSAALECLREAYKKLDEAAKPIRELCRTVGTDSHSIQNQLMAIYGYAVLLNQSKNLAGEEREMLDGITKAAANLQNLTQGILKLAKSSAAFREDV